MVANIVKNMLILVLMLVWPLHGSSHENIRMKELRNEAEAKKDKIMLMLDDIAHLDEDAQKQENLHQELEEQLDSSMELARMIIEIEQIIGVNDTSPLDPTEGTFGQNFRYWLFDKRHRWIMQE